VFRQDRAVSQSSLISLRTAETSLSREASLGKSVATVGWREAECHERFGDVGLEPAGESRSRSSGSFVRPRLGDRKGRPYLKWF
jgi:hypothetical protein